MNEKIKLDSGAMLEMTLLDFEAAMELFQTVSAELLKVNIDLGSLNFGDVAGSEVDQNIINTLKNIVLTLIVSKDLRDVLNKSFARCTYNNIKITPETFEDVKTRGDYFIVCWEVLKFNLLPFFPGIGSQFMKNFQLNGLIRKQQ